MSPMSLPITLTTAGILGLLALVLSFRVSAARGKYKINIGDGGNADLLVRIRTHANFVEYVPLLLILLGLLELSGANRIALLVGAVLLILARISHAIGMAGPIALRAVGAMTTSLLLVAGSIYGLVLAIPNLHA